MSNIAFSFFGTSDGTNGFYSPKTFPLRGALSVVVDTSLPFDYGKEVFRYLRIEGENSESTIGLLALYTKIDDFGGAREGSFAGAGILVNSGTVDAYFAVGALREMVTNLLNAATNNRTFIAKIDDAVNAGRIQPPALAGQVVSSFSRGDQRSHISEHGRFIFHDSDVLARSPEMFFAISQIFAKYLPDDIYWANDAAFCLNAAENFGVLRASFREALAFGERAIVGHHVQAIRKLEKSLSDQTTRASAASQELLRHQHSMESQRRTLLDSNRQLIENLQQQINQRDNEIQNLRKMVQSAPLTVELIGGTQPAPPVVSNQQSHQFTVELERSVQTLKESVKRKDKLIEEHEEEIQRLQEQLEQQAGTTNLSPTGSLSPAIMKRLVVAGLVFVALVASGVAAWYMMRPVPAPPPPKTSTTSDTPATAPPSVAPQPSKIYLKSSEISLSKSINSPDNTVIVIPSGRFAKIDILVAVVIEQANNRNCRNRIKSEKDKLGKVNAEKDIRELNASQLSTDGLEVGDDFADVFIDTGCKSVVAAAPIAPPTTPASKSKVSESVPAASGEKKASHQ